MLLLMKMVKLIGILMMNNILNENHGCGNKVDKRGYNMQTATGLAVYPLNLLPQQIKIDDIAASLSRICRFNGHLRDDVEHYSVAQHSVHVSRLVGDDLDIQRQALLHDATEAYVGDVIRPLKLSLNDYHLIELKVWKAVCIRFNMREIMYHEVKLADQIALSTEFRDIIIPNGFADKGELMRPDDKIIRPLRSHLARELFIDRINELGII